MAAEFIATAAKMKMAAPDFMVFFTLLKAIIKMKVVECLNVFFKLGYIVTVHKFEKKRLYHVSFVMFVVYVF